VSGTEHGRVLAHLREGLLSGKTLSRAVDDMGRAFPSGTAATLEAGERADRLADVLLSLAESAEQEGSLRHSIALTVAYPLILGLCGAALVAFADVYIIPQIADMAVEFEIWSAGGLRAWQWTLVGIQIGGFLLLVVPAVGLVLVYLAPIPWGRWTRSRDRLRLGIPALGKVVRWLCLVRWCRTMRCMIAAEVGEPEAVRLAGRASGNRVIEEDCEEISRRIESGERLGDALAGMKRFPKVFCWALRMVEARGGHGHIWPTVIELFRDGAREAGAHAFMVLSVAFTMLAYGIVGAGIVTVLLPLIRLMESIGG